MSEKRDFIELVHRIFEGKKCDVEQYVKEVTKCIDKVYRSSGRPSPSRPADPKAQKKTYFYDRDFEDFENACWEKLEKSLLSIIYNMEFLNDNLLKGHLRKSFERLLIDIGRTKNPSYNTRISQVNRVLKPLCRKEDEDKVWCLNLNDHENVTNDSADIDHLHKAVQDLTIPQKHYRKSQEAIRGEEIKDDDMEKFLIELFQSVGGAIYIKDLEKLVSELFVRGSHTTMSMQSYEDDNSDMEKGKNSAREDQVYFTVHEEKKDELISCSHIAMANELYDLMNQEMLELYHMSIIKKLTLEKMAKRIGVKSPGTVSNRMAEMQLKFKKYFDQKSSVIEEAKLVLNILSCIIIEKKQVINEQ